MSHLRALAMAATAGAGPYWIAEDDVVFGSRTLHYLDRVLDRLKASSWDILFTDVIVAQPADMLDLWTRRNQLNNGDSVDLFALDRMPFGGTTSYLVHPRAFARIARLRERSTTFDIPWDLWLRKMARQRQLTCIATLPFLTRPAHAPSQIQLDGKHMAWWAVFRDLMFHDADAERIGAKLAELDNAPPLSTLFGRVMSNVSQGTFVAPGITNTQSRATSIARSSNAESFGSDAKSDSST